MRARGSVPMACLYSPYSFNRVADGGFCDPVRILLTVLSAWLNTLSAHGHRLAIVSQTPQWRIHPGLPLWAYVPTESDMAMLRCWWRRPAAYRTAFIQKRWQSKRYGDSDYTMLDLQESKRRWRRRAWRWLLAAGRWWWMLR